MEGGTGMESGLQNHMSRHVCRQRLPNGQITTAAGTMCVGAVGDAVILTGCDGGDSWATQANGKLQSARMRA